MPIAPDTRTIPAPPVSIVPATDLGSVEVAKHGNLYLLTDPRGDIRVDGRGLGLYDLDTRILSTSVLRLNGAALTLLRGPYARRRRRHDPADQPGAPSQPARQALGRAEPRPPRAQPDPDPTDRRRPRASGSLVVNYSATAQDIELELGLGADMADIFEVRGYPRPGRGTLRPIELDGDRVVFGYDGLDKVRRTTTVVIDGGGRLDPVPDGDDRPGASVVAQVVGAARTERAADRRLGGDDVGR